MSVTEGGTPAIPYAFAKRFGVVVLGEEGAGVSVGLREGDDPRALTEVRRVLGRPLAINRIDRKAFERLLSERYATDGLDAEQVSERLEIGRASCREGVWHDV